mmetsp:Transcript_24167/g.52628  ORF Transcript_24167/g.52628 Transcript_24167/m.52628 type:complete len:80 (-) Transcript_24167:601-840(-)
MSTHDDDDASCWAKAKAPLQGILVLVHTCRRTTAVAWSKSALACFGSSSESSRPHQYELVPGDSHFHCRRSGYHLSDLI